MHSLVPTPSHTYKFFLYLYNNLFQSASATFGPTSDYSDLVSLRARAAKLQGELAARGLRRARSSAAAAGLAAKVNAVAADLDRRKRAEEGGFKRTLRARQEEVLKESGKWDEASEKVANVVDGVLERIRGEELK